MADDVTLNPGAGGDVVAADDIAGAKYQEIKVVLGADGVNDGAVHGFNGFPISASEALADPFGRLRISAPTGKFSAQLQYDLHRILWESSLSGSGTDTHDANGSGTDIAVTASASDAVIRQTRKYLRYQAGHGQEILITGNLNAAVAGIDERIGYFDADNGLFLEQFNTGVLNFVLRSKVTGSVVNNKAPQASWNIDKFDGTGHSKITLDVSKSQIIIIDLEWLSVGRVRVGFMMKGKILYAHEFDNSNTISGAYMTTANLPVRYEIDNVTGANAGSLKCLCTSVISEGGATENEGLQFAASNGITLKSIGTTKTSAVSIRPKATFNSIVNRGLIIPTGVTAYTKDQAGLFEIWYGATLGGSPSWVSVNDDSLVEQDVAGTTLTGGILLASGMVDKKGDFILPATMILPLTLNIAGAHPTSPYTDSLTVAFTALQGSSGVTATTTFREVR